MMAGHDATPDDTDEVLLQVPIARFLRADVAFLAELEGRALEEYAAQVLEEHVWGKLRILGLFKRTHPGAAPVA